MAIWLPRIPAIALSSRPRMSRPWNLALPVMVAFRSLTRPMTEYIDTLLPDPDSPTMLSTSPGATWSESPFTACTVPARVRNRTLRSSTSRTGACGLATTHPRVQPGVHHVDRGVRDHDEERRVHDSAHDHWQVQILQ